MIGSSIELIAPTEEELKAADKIASSIGCRVIYVTPNLVQIAGVARSLSNSKYGIYVMVDYPKGNKYGMDKFKGTSTDFFLADGYDIILTPSRTVVELRKEIETSYSFIKNMVSPHVDVCYTINASLREDDEIQVCAEAFHRNPPTKIKIEASATVQPTKANLGVHKKTIEKIRKYCTTPIAVSGNINYNVYKELRSSHKIAVSPKQYDQMAKQEETEAETKEIKLREQQQSGE